MSLLASVVFALAAFCVITAARATVLQYRDAALANVAALRDCSDAREFRVQAVCVVARNAIGADIRRVAARTIQPRRIRQSRGLRAAA
ncbi:hypothetical protein [Novosphingobium sp. Gsoil 351]|uniref:hypothetical protein n=1 Tax=Novosphingobium sp. Gsoil 351 TaxID=2675225 RepID=UPI0012B47446|nr:hypothetical protein [Novosphingobium sp. Gsoil 351]QGN56020.1 hypothetical protein GKE62_17180 [Novosphingobium sp. Gsoil 351]